MSRNRQQTLEDLECRQHISTKQRENARNLLTRALTPGNPSMYRGRPKPFATVDGNAVRSDAPEVNETRNGNGVGGSYPGRTRGVGATGSALFGVASRDLRKSDNAKSAFSGMRTKEPMAYYMFGMSMCTSSELIRDPQAHPILHDAWLLAELGLKRFWSIVRPPDWMQTLCKRSVQIESWTILFLRVVITHAQS